MKLLVIGQSVEDHIHSANGEIIQPGGIYYTAAGLMSIKDEGDEICLCTSFEEKNYQLFSPVYEKLNRDNFQKVESIPKVHLNIYEQKERHEKYVNITETLKLDNIDFNLFDGILINMITGFDITISQLEEIRKNFHGVIYFDVHTFSRGVDENMNRNFRRIPGFNRWAKLLDLIQVNQYELKTVSSFGDEKEAAKEILNYGVKILIVTKGNLGARIYSYKNGELFSIYKSALKVNVKNKVGCGDVFGAVFCYSYIKNKDLINALNFANNAAGLTASYDSVNNLKKLKDDLFSGHS
jgi:pfkB family carbohydrate kinase